MFLNKINLRAYVPTCLLAMLFAFTACSDTTSLEPEASAEVNLPQSDIDLKIKLVLADKVFEDVVSNNNRLVFIDSIHFVRTLERLEIASREQDNALIAKALQDQFSYKNLWIELETSTTEWLAQQPRDMDYNLSPDNHFVQDDYVRMLLSSEGEVKVGSYVYKIWPNGLLLEVDSTSPAALAFLQETAPNPASLPSGVSIKLYPQDYIPVDRKTEPMTTNLGACRANQASDWYDRNYEGGAKKAEMKVLARNYFWGVRKLEAITKVFEWRSGKWRKTEDPIANAVWGRIYDSTTNECGIGATSVDRSNDVEDTHKLVCKLNWLPQFRIESGEVLSRHNLPGGISQELPLEW